MRPRHPLCSSWRSLDPATLQLLGFPFLRLLSLCRIVTPDPSAEIRDLARGVRAISCAFALVICYFNVLLSLKIGKFEEICADLLGGKPLPPATAFLFEARWYFVALALALPIGALLAVCLIRSHRIALTLAGGVLVVAFLQMHFTWSALMAPLLGILSGLQANG